MSSANENLPNRKVFKESLLSNVQAADWAKARHNLRVNLGQIAYSDPNRRVSWQLG